MLFQYFQKGVPVSMGIKVFWETTKCMEMTYKTFLGKTDLNLQCNILVHFLKKSLINCTLVATQVKSTLPKMAPERKNDLMRFLGFGDRVTD